MVWDGQQHLMLAESGEGREGGLDSHLHLLKLSFHGSTLGVLGLVGDRAGAVAHGSFLLLGGGIANAVVKAGTSVGVGSRPEEKRGFLGGIRFCGGVKGGCLIFGL